MNYKEARELLKAFNKIKNTNMPLANKVYEYLLNDNWDLVWQKSERRFDVKRKKEGEGNIINKTQE